MGVNGLTTVDLRKNYGSKTVLNGLSFDAVSGGITLLAGRNGVGKTTWLRIALGMSRPASGDVLFDGQPLHAIRPRVAAVFDEPAVYPHLNGYENLYVMSGGEVPDSDGAKNLLRSLDFEPVLLRRKGSSFSFGQRKRLAIAAALLRNPRWLLLDEPTIGLDPAAWELIRDAIQRLAMRGVTVVLTSQDLNALEHWVHYVTVIKAGVTVFQGTQAKLTEADSCRVRVRTSQPDQILRDYPGAHCVQQAGLALVEIACTSPAAAEGVLERIRSLRLPLQLLEIRQLTLQEAFLALTE